MCGREGSLPAAESLKQLAWQASHTACQFEIEQVRLEVGCRPSGPRNHHVQCDWIETERFEDSISWLDLAP